VRIAQGKRSAPLGTRCGIGAPPQRGGTNPAQPLIPAHSIALRENPCLPTDAGELR
jgi:hypothetical protein